MKKGLKGYKAFNKDMTCQGFQFEEGKIYEEKKAVICQSGFHFCTDPLDVLNYYDICDSEFTEVEAIGTINKNDYDYSKKCTTKIKIGVKIGLSGFINASIKFLLDSCKTNKKSGDYSKSAQSGYNSKSAQSGDNSTSAQSGYNSKSAQSGYNSKSAQSGYNSTSAQSGYYSTSAQSGDNSKSAQSGYCSTSAQSGDNSTSMIEGKYSVAASIGNNSKVKAKKGCWITLAEWEYDDTKDKWIPVCVKSAQIDGKKLKEDIFYQLINKKFVEVTQ